MAVARCLKDSTRFNLNIVGLSYDALDPGLYATALCDTSWLLPYPSVGEDVFVERLASIYAQTRFDVLIPCLDAELPVLAGLASRLAQWGVKTLLPTSSQLQMRSKDRLPELAKQAGVQCPATQPVLRETFFHQCADSGFRYPFVVKGLFYDAAIVYTVEQGLAAFRRISAEWGLPVLVQTLIPGEEVNLAGIGDGSGGLLGAVMMKKRQLTDKGKAWAGVTIHDEELLAAAQRLVAATRWYGPLEVEAMRGRDNKLYLIEINPRFPAWIYLSAGANRNLPELAVALAMGEKIEKPSPAPAGVMFIRYAWDVIVPLANFESLVVGGQLLTVD